MKKLLLSLGALAVLSSPVLADGYDRNAPAINQPLAPEAAWTVQQEEFMSLPGGFARSPRDTQPWDIATGKAAIMASDGTLQTSAYGNR